MKTLLDKCHTLFLNKIEYQGADELKIFMIEGIPSESVETVHLGESKLGDCTPIQIQDNSKAFIVNFNFPVAWQVIDESHTTFNKNEGRDSKDFIQIIQNSAYHNYISSNSCLQDYVKEMAKHYRIWSEDEIIEIISTEKPSISLLPD